MIVAIIQLEKMQKSKRKIFKFSLVNNDLLDNKNFKKTKILDKIYNNQLIALKF